MSAALTQLAAFLSDDKATLVAEIKDKVDVEACRVLGKLVPTLGNALGVETLDPSYRDITDISTYSLNQKKLQKALLKLLRVVCTSTPVVFVCDDLQWADRGAIQILQALVKDNISGLLLVGICRHNEVSLEHELADMLRRLEDDVGAHIIHVQVKNLSIPATKQLVSDMIGISADSSLADRVHEKSDGGNPFYILQLVKAMHRSGVLDSLLMNQNDNSLDSRFGIMKVVTILKR